MHVCMYIVPMVHQPAALFQQQLVGVDAFVIRFVEAVEFAQRLNDHRVLESVSRPVRRLDGFDDSIQADFPRPIGSYRGRNR